MSRNGSERAFTLVEIAVALAVSGILVAVLAGFFRNFQRSFNLQEQMSDRDLNAHFTVKRLSEALMAAGSNLPSKGLSVINLPEGNPGPRFRISVNPRGGIQYVSTAQVGVLELQVDDPKGFAGVGQILLVPENEALTNQKVDIDRGYNADGFSEGVKPNGSGALLRLKSAVNLSPGDQVYAYDEEVYRLEGTDLMLNDMVLAENIEAITVSAYTAGQDLTNQWSAMRSARIQIRARTRHPDPGYSKDGGFRKLELSTDVLLRNRI